MTPSISYSIRRGVTLVEVAVSTVLVGVVLVASLKTVGSALQTARSGQESANAQVLAELLLAEIMTRPYEEREGSSVFGIEADETSSPTNREAFDDLDDYHGWSRSPPQAENGANLPGFEGWSRSVEVRRIAETTPLTALAGDIGLRQVIVTVTDPQGAITSLAALRSKHSAVDQLPAVDTTMAIRVTASLSVHGGAAAHRSVPNNNHALQP